MDLRHVQRMLAPIYRQVRLMFDRAIVTMVTDSLQRQNLQLKALADEAPDGIERFQNYGMTSVPPAGSEAIIASIGGKRSGLVAIVVEDKTVRPKGGQEGDVCMYHLEGHNLLLTKDGKAILTVKDVTLNVSEKLTIICPDNEIQGPLKVSGPITCEDAISAAGGISSAGDISADGDITAGTVSVRHHKHPEHDGGETDEPTP
jgi:phage baseplate assembly protein V